jgi:Rps23 Pro-64 3,4-dihydroxylase Tpa1-like proline 4-hydroxylase
MTDRKVIADIILQKLELNKERLREHFFTENQINSFTLDDLLPDELAQSIFISFPETEEMVLKKSLREHKYIAVQMGKYNPLLEEIIFSFQDERILQLITHISGIQILLPDEHLYAGGISLMNQGCFLNPHIDNSHDAERENYRVLNLLYYVTPDWDAKNGGNLELWDGGLGQRQRTIISKFNRLVVMITNRASWHSVSPVLVSKNRCCVSNYYFSPTSAESEEYFHVTSFRGRPEEAVKDVLLQGDNILRNGVRKIFRKGLLTNTHIYRK